MAKYKNTVTCEIFTLDEIREANEECFWDIRSEFGYTTFKDWFEAMCQRGDFEEIEN